MTKGGLIPDTKTSLHCYRKNFHPDAKPESRNLTDRTENFRRSFPAHTSVKIEKLH